MYMKSISNNLLVIMPTYSITLQSLIPIISDIVILTLDAFSIYSLDIRKEVLKVRVNTICRFYNYWHIYISIKKWKILDTWDEEEKIETVCNH